MILEHVSCLWFFRLVFDVNTVQIKCMMKVNEYFGEGNYCVGYCITKWFFKSFQVWETNCFSVLFFILFCFPLKNHFKLTGFTAKGLWLHGLHGDRF